MDLTFILNESILITAIVVIISLALYTDLRWRKIPNCLTLPAIALRVIWSLFHKVVDLIPRDNVNISCVDTNEYS